MKHAFILPSLLLLGIVACKKPSIQDHAIIGYTEPIVFATSLADSIPAKTYLTLNVGNVLGVKVKYPQTGKEVRYFEYEADHKLLLKELSKIAFDKYAGISDTLCRRIEFSDIRQSPISAFEIETAFAFWNVDEKEFDVFECIKSPVKHCVLVHKKSKKVLHRIEYT